MAAPAVTLEDVLAELRELRAAVRGRATTRQRPRLDSLLLPLQHAAELLGVGRPTLRELVRAGELLQVKTITGDPRITRRSLDEHLQRLEQQATTKKRRPAPPPPKVPPEPPAHRSPAEVAKAIQALRVVPDGKA